MATDISADGQDLEFPPDSREQWDIWAREYIATLTDENISESTEQARQRRVTLASLEVLQAFVPDAQFFNELLIQYPVAGQALPGRVTPDNFLVIHPEPLDPHGHWGTIHQPVTPFWVMEYVSPNSERKDYVTSFGKYQRLGIPYYLTFQPEVPELRLYRLDAGRYVRLEPDAAGRLAVPELEVAVGLLGGWVRFWYRGELIDLPGEVTLERNELRDTVAVQAEVIEEARESAAQERERADAERAARREAERQAEAERERAEAESARRAEAERRAETAERQIAEQKSLWQAQERELAALREALSRSQPPA